MHPPPSQLLTVGGKGEGNERRVAAASHLLWHLAELTKLFGKSTTI